MTITLVQVIKGHAWHSTLKNYIFAVVEHVDKDATTRKRRSHAALFWQVLQGDYNYLPAGFKPGRIVSPYLLQKKHVQVVGEFEVLVKAKKVTSKKAKPKKK